MIRLEELVIVVIAAAAGALLYTVVHWQLHKLLVKWATHPKLLVGYLQVSRIIPRRSLVAEANRRSETDFVTTILRQENAAGVYIELVHDSRCNPPYLLYAGHPKKQRLLLFWHRDEAIARQQHADTVTEWGL